MVEGADLETPGRNGRQRAVHARENPAGVIDPNLALRLRHPFDPKRPRELRRRKFSSLPDDAMSASNSSRPFQGHHAGLVAGWRTHAIRRKPQTAGDAPF
jgi:hypothetical protein